MERGFLWKRRSRGRLAKGAWQLQPPVHLGDKRPVPRRRIDAGRLPVDRAEMHDHRSARRPTGVQIHRIQIGEAIRHQQRRRLGFAVHGHATLREHMTGDRVGKKPLVAARLGDLAHPRGQTCNDTRAVRARIAKGHALLRHQIVWLLQHQRQMGKHMPRAILDGDERFEARVVKQRRQPLQVVESRVVRVAITTPRQPAQRGQIGLGRRTHHGVFVGHRVALPAPRSLASHAQSRRHLRLRRQMLRQPQHLAQMPVHPEFNLVHTLADEAQSHARPIRQIARVVRLVHIVQRKGRAAFTQRDDQRTRNQLIIDMDILRLPRLRREVFDRVGERLLHGQFQPAHLLAIETQHPRNRCRISRHGMQEGDGDRHLQLP